MPATNINERIDAGVHHLDCTIGLHWPWTIDLSRLDMGDIDGAGDLAPNSKACVLCQIHKATWLNAIDYAGLNDSGEARALGFELGYEDVSYATLTNLWTQRILELRMARMGSTPLNERLAQQ